LNIPYLCSLGRQVWNKYVVSRLKFQIFAEKTIAFYSRPLPFPVLGENGKNFKLNKALTLEEKCNNKIFTSGP
jgi:hypothetical protein